MLLALAAGLYRICPLRFKPAWMLATSYVFYVTWSLTGAILLAGITV